LVSGPGCPVCVTPVGYIDHALALAARPEVIIATFGDLLRVPGSMRQRGPGASAPSLERVRATGADVRIVYSPFEALHVARDNAARQVVFLGVGFETTTPPVAAAMLTAHEQGLKNLSVLGAHKTIPEAMQLLASGDQIGLDGFLCPGHVSIIIGPEAYQPLAERHRLACAIAGFEPIEILRGLLSLIEQIDTDQPRIDNCYPGAVRAGGNRKARELMYRVFEPCDANWRGFGVIPHSGLSIRSELATLDAASRFDVALPPPVEPAGCRCGEVLQGVIVPAECPLFGDACTPDNPHGACMVSSEGSCAAHFHYGTAKEQADG